MNGKEIFEHCKQYRNNEKQKGEIERRGRKSIISDSIFGVDIHMQRSIQMDFEHL